MNGLLKTLIKPDWDDNPKRSEILYAANLLQIGEFQLIQLAYKVWYNENFPENKINKIFSEYMITGIIPIWVTYYAKNILKLDQANILDIIMKNITFMITNLEHTSTTINKGEDVEYYMQQLLHLFLLPVIIWLLIMLQIMNPQVFTHLILKNK